jgi:hypothetical protein
MYARYRETLHGKLQKDCRPGKVNTLFIVHHYRISAPRHRGLIGAFFDHNSDDELPDGRATLVSRGDCWLNSRGLDLKAS